MLVLSYAVATFFYQRPTLTELNFVKVDIDVVSITLSKNGPSCTAANTFCSTLDSPSPSCSISLSSCWASLFGSS